LSTAFISDVALLDQVEELQPPVVYFLAIEITRRRLASVISRFALRALASPCHLLVDLTQVLDGSTTRFCRSESLPAVRARRQVA